MRQRIRGNLL